VHKYLLIERASGHFFHVVSSMHLRRRREDRHHRCIRENSKI